jgi:hypothetical protein
MQCSIKDEDVKNLKLGYYNTHVAYFSVRSASLVPSKISHADKSKLKQLTCVLPDDCEQIAILNNFKLL